MKTSKLKERLLIPRCLRRGVLFIQFLSFIFGMHLLVSTVQANFNEYQVKAAFIFNFIVFTKWPNSIDEKLTFCIYGEDDFGQEIDKLQARSANNNNIAVLRLTSLERVKECQALFISKSAINTLPNILSSIQGASILTIADSPDASSKGVMINMSLIQNKINFEVNQESANSANLRISSRLLQLATKVYQ